MVKVGNGTQEVRQVQWLSSHEHDLAAAIARERPRPRVFGMNRFWGVFLEGSPIGDEFRRVVPSHSCVRTSKLHIT